MATLHSLVEPYLDGLKQLSKLATAAISDYILSNNTRGNKPFAKVVSIIGPHYQADALHKKLQREQNREKFCKNVSEDQLVTGKYGFSILVASFCFSTCEPLADLF